MQKIALMQGLCWSDVKCLAFLWPDQYKNVFVRSSQHNGEVHQPVLHQGLFWAKRILCQEDWVRYLNGGTL